jgi:hypothetical protein
MKNRKLTYILLISVIIIWILVFYRLFFEGKVSFETTTTITKSPVKKLNEKEKKVKILIANYRDPFLERKEQAKIESKKEEVTKVSNNLRRRKTNVSKNKWPVLKYGGFIEDDKDQKITILLNLNRKDYLVQEGDTIESIVIKKFYTDSLLVSYKNEEKIIRK